MLCPRTLLDPLGNQVLIPNSIAKKDCQKLNDIRHVIASPAFIIKAHDEKLYFFRLIGWETNMMVAVGVQKNQHIVHSCIENPSVDYISSLLRRGALMSFQ